MDARKGDALANGNTDGMININNILVHAKQDFIFINAGKKHGSGYSSSY